MDQTIYRKDPEMEPRLEKLEHHQSPSRAILSCLPQVSSHFDHWHQLPVRQMDAMLQGVQQAVVKRAQLNQRLSGDLTVLQERQFLWGPAVLDAAIVMQQVTRL